MELQLAPFYAKVPLKPYPVKYLAPNETNYICSWQDKIWSQGYKHPIVISMKFSIKILMKYIILFGGCVCGEKAKKHF